MSSGTGTSQPECAVKMTIIILSEYTRFQITTLHATHCSVSTHYSYPSYIGRYLSSIEYKKKTWIYTRMDRFFWLLLEFSPSRSQKAPRSTFWESLNSIELLTVILWEFNIFDEKFSKWELKRFILFRMDI